MTTFARSKADVLSQEYRIPAVEDGRLQLPGYTTAERDALSAFPGDIILNTTTNKLNFFTGAVWEEVTSA